MAEVTLYTTPTCPFCKMTKDFFKEHHVEYKEHDVSRGIEWAEEMIRQTRQMAVPVIAIKKDGKEETVVGFDKDRLAKILGLE